MISILLASYNGEKYIDEQIKSILNQTIQDFVIYINDDRSTDNTFAIVQRYAKEFPDKIIATQNEKNSGNAKYNFIEMMIEHDDDYVMLCDQDDVWLPDKIELTLGCIRQLENEYGKQTPALVYTDLRVVDEELNKVSVSFQHMMNANFSRHELKDELIQNTLTGCTAMYNFSLSNLIDTEPNYMIMHDWWLILVASAFGIVHYINKPTVLYRQHGENSIGAKNMKSFFYNLRLLIDYKYIRNAINETYFQSQSLLDVYSQKLSPEQKKLTAAYCAIPDMSKIKRLKTILELGTLKYSFARKLAHLIFI